MGQWKPVLPFGGSTIIETAVAAALGACSRVILVAGFRAAELAALFHDNARVMVVENTDWETGMFSSLRRGAGRVETERFFIAPGDMPLLATAVYATLLSAAPADAVFPVFGGRRGHPVLLARKVAEEMLRADPATGIMRGILAGFASREIEWSDDSILRDFDTPQEYSSNRT
jgi:molybdenum cofactor cytidylyltransferase